MAKAPAPPLGERSAPAAGRRSPPKCDADYSIGRHGAPGAEVGLGALPTRPGPAGSVGARPWLGRARRLEKTVANRAFFCGRFDLLGYDWRARPPLGRRNSGPGPWARADPGGNAQARLGGDPARAAQGFGRPRGADVNGATECRAARAAPCQTKGDAMAETTIEKSTTNSAKPRSSFGKLLANLSQIRRLAEKVSPYFELLNADPKAAEISPDYKELKELVSTLHPADMAYILEALPLEERIVAWFLVDPEEDGEVLLEVSDSVRETLIASMTHRELVDAVEDLDADELADLAPDLPLPVMTEAMDSRDEDEQRQIRSALSYGDEQVGSIMDFDLLKILPDVSCEIVLRYLRHFEELPDQTDKIFVVDADDKLLGVLPIRKLLVSPPEKVVRDLMTTDVVSFAPTDDNEGVAQSFERYDLVTAPVLDSDGKLIGRITVDEIVDVIRESGEEDMLNMAGLQEEEDLFSPVWDSVKNRWKWVAINLCTAFVASRVIGLFEDSISQIVALAALMPIVAGIGGNNGNQTITMIVRALATGQLNPKHAWDLGKKEVGVALVNGMIFGAVMGLATVLLYRNWGIGLLMMVAMTLNLVLAAVVGVLIPLTMQKLGKDPALGSSVLITAVTDSGGFFIFLGLATIFLL